MNTNTYDNYCDLVFNASLSVDTGGVVNKAVKCLAAADCVYFCGNGGSAANASHFSQDLFKFCFDNNAVKKTFSLVDSVPIITATSNDSDYSLVFSNVLFTMATKEDALVIISGSGNSENIVKAAKSAFQKNIPVIAMVGYDGGVIKSEGLYTYLLHVQSFDMGVVESVHGSLIHYLTHSVVSKMKEGRLF